MKVTNLKKGKKTFLSQLYYYKEKECMLLDCIKDVKKFMDKFHAMGVATDIVIDDSSNLIANKYTFLKGSFLRSDMDLVFFRDEDELYPANFFAGCILEHFVLKIDDILAALEAFCIESEKFDIRAVEITTNKKFRVLISVLSGKKFYDFDEVAKAALDDMRDKFQVFKNELDDFYKEDPFYDYPQVVEYNLRKSLENIEGLDKDKLTSVLTSFYEIDVDFLRKIKKEREIYLVRKLYLKYMSEAGLDTSGIVEDPVNRYFTVKHHDVFDPTEYLDMNMAELSRALLILEFQEAGDILNDKDAYNSLKNILSDVGIVLQTPITITEDDIKNSENSSDEKRPKRK